MLAGALCLGLTACANSGDTAGGGSSSAPSAPPTEAASAQPTPSAEPTPTPTPTPTPEPQAQALTLGQVYTGTDCEVTFNDISIGTKCEVQLNSYSSTSREASEGNSLIIIETAIANTGTSAMDMWDAEPFTAVALYDGQYEYEADSSFVGENEITPLDNKTECMTIEIPAAVVNGTESLVVDITIGGETYQHVIR